MGIVEVCAETHHDSTTEDERWECVDIKAVCSVERAVTLADIKAEPALEEMVLVNNSRLSVQLVTDAHWRKVCKMAGVAP